MSGLELALVILGIFFSVVFSAALTVGLYLYFSKKLKQGSGSFAESDLRASISRVNEARANDTKELNHRIDALEGRVDALLMPEGDAKELAKEKVKVQAKK
ncbi:MAG: hypothetical protein HY544_01035 [Candidatus Diapherotrites archaeon]|uniref:Uncharacterized protein n=1 Tax=Candidatus Iainarchaeum sp. TaxID=3101447 RepID=A0A8T3YL88_9ARCH|nr:hypothetical protein [Candidatus Diapherotrites archaeon]